MSGINSISRLLAIPPDSAGQKPASPTAPVTDVGTSREDSLKKQLDDQLSSEIARIRRQISNLNRPDPNSADGNGRILNISA
jgi:hypothetical protein